MTACNPGGQTKDQLASSLLMDICSWGPMTDQARWKEISLLTFFLPLKITPGFLGAERAFRASVLTWRTSLSNSEKAKSCRKAWLPRKLRSVCLSLGAEKPSNVNRTDRFGLLSTRLQCGFKGSFMWGLCIHSCILVSWRVNPFSYHWQPSQGKRLNALVSGVRAKEDQRVSKPVNHGGTSANTLHKLLWPQGIGQMVGWAVPMMSSLHLHHLCTAFKNIREHNRGPPCNFLYFMKKEGKIKRKIITQKK